MNNIRLTTPPQKDDENPAVELNPGNLERWLDALPVNDVLETINKLDEAISSFNEIKVTPANRLKLLEVYFSAFHSILQGYDEMRIAQLKVSTKQKQQISSKILWLHIKLSHGYKIIVKDYAANSEGGKPPQFLLLAVFRALELTVISLISAYRFGLDTPPLTYIEMHQLFAFAEYCGIADKALKSVSGYAKTPTIGSFYTLALIFDSLDPAQYESYTLEVLFLALQPFTFRCPISRTCDPGTDSYVYKINSAENQPPSLVVENNVSAISESIRYLDIGNFLSGINDWLEKNQDDDGNFLIEHELELFPGVITRLNTNLNTKKAQLEESKAAQAENQHLKLVFGFLQLESLLIMKSADLGLQLDYSMTEWAARSQTSSGCELIGHIDLVNEELSLGDLVAIVSGGEEGESVSLSKIAYINQLQQMEEGELLVGLEYLSGNAYPLIYMMMSDEGKTLNAAQSNGIYLLDEESQDNPPVMIVSRKHYQEEQHYLIKTREKACMVVATKLIRKTLRYAFFEINILQEERSSSPDTINTFNIAV